MNNQLTTSPLKIGLDVMPSYSLGRTRFGQYQTCMTVGRLHLVSLHFQPELDVLLEIST